MKRRNRTGAVIAVAGALLSLSGCGGSSDHHAAAQPLPALCGTALNTDEPSALRSAVRQIADEPVPVALSSCKPDANRNIDIPAACGPNVVVDKDFTGGDRLGKITIDSGGKLVFPNLGAVAPGTPVTLTLETAGIRINDGGFFGVGTAACPIGGYPGAHATIVFTGDRDLSCAPATGCDDGSVKGIEVRSGGILRMYGAKGVPSPAGSGAPGVSWTALSQTAPSQSSTLHLSADVTKGQRPWQQGDWIVIGTSSFSPFESEFVRIAADPTSDPDGGSTVTVAQALQYSHFGSDAPTPGQRCEVNGAIETVACGSQPGCTAPCTSAPSARNFNDPAQQNFGIDERAEVGLISRSITLTASVPAPPPPDREPLNPDPSLHWGGEIRIAGGDKGAPHVTIVGVELEKFGKDQLGSYPIHLHMIGDATNAVTLNANSIHHSYNKCITVHMSSNLTVEDNVCARIVGHIFYEEFGSEENISFRRNLGLGAMSNSFDIYKVKTLPPTVTEIARSQLISDHWWKGDNLAKNADYNYDGFNIPNTDDQHNPSRGSCMKPDGIGGFIGTAFAPNSKEHQGNCTAGEIYTEPASGFWITNPTTELIGNAIGGCQGVGRAFWWVTPSQPIMVNGNLEDLKFKPLGIPGHPQAFFDNRGHGCYAGFYAEEEYSVHSTVLVPHKGGTNTGAPVIAEFDGMTATRNRFRGVWLRPTWFVVKDGRFATNRENVSLVTSGGIDGNAPGVWALLKDSVVAGVSANNVDRFGPCKTENQLGQFTGAQLGCVDHTPPPTGVVPHSADEVGLGYPPPSWNMFGYMLYDGPVRVFDTRFVNFKADVSSLLTAADNTFLAEYSASHNTSTAQVCVGGNRLRQHCNVDTDCCPGGSCPGACPLPSTRACTSGTNKSRACTTDADCCANAADCSGACSAVHFVYEGDAALGWFQSNQSSYPTGTVTRGLSFVNTDLRHQIYTDKVSVNLEFNDGDKNTAVIDEDGTLTGFGVGDARNGFAPPKGFHPISLNNLPFNATSNSVDECFSRGQQNHAFEGRDSSLISAGSLGTLEFSTLYPWRDRTDDGTPIPFPGPDGDTSHTQFLTFTRDDPERDADGMPRRNAGGIIHSDMTLHSRDGRGVWEPKVTSGFGYTVAASPAPNFSGSTGRAGIASVIDVGVADVIKPDISAKNPFFVRLGICYTGADNSHPQDPTKFTITRGYKSYTGGAVNPDDQELQKYWTPSTCTNLDSLNTANLTGPTCPAPRERRVAVPESGTCPDGSTRSGDSCVFPTDNLDRVDRPEDMFNPDGSPNLETFFYDKTAGMLFLWVAQDEPNPVGPSPLGSCTGNAATDDPSCPDLADGETYYACPVKGCHIYVVKLDDPSYSPGASKCQPYETYAGGPFAPQYELVLHGTTTPVKPVLEFDKAGDPFHTTTEATNPMCQATTAIRTESAMPAYPAAAVPSGAQGEADEAKGATVDESSAADSRAPAASPSTAGADRSAAPPPPAPAAGAGATPPPIIAPTPTTTPAPLPKR